jgi:single-stranded DNA-binding protein
VSASIANNEHYTDAQGQEQKITTFVNLEVWGKPAENFGKLVKKGQELCVDAKLRTASRSRQKGDANPPIATRPFQGMNRFESERAVKAARFRQLAEKHANFATGRHFAAPRTT